MYRLKKSTLLILLISICLISASHYVQAYTSNGVIDKVTYKMIKVKSVDIRKYPLMDSEVITTAHKNQQVVIITESGEWYKILVNRELGWVKKTYLTEYKKTDSKNSISMIPTSKPTNTPTPKPTNTPTPKPTNTPTPKPTNTPTPKPTNTPTPKPTNTPTPQPTNTPTTINIMTLTPTNAPSIGSNKPVSLIEDAVTQKQREQSIINSPEYATSLNQVKGLGVLISQSIKDIATILSTGKSSDSGINNNTQINTMPYNKDLSDKVVAEAKKQLGVQYLKWGKNPEGFDSSGLVNYIFKQNNIDIKRRVIDQAKLGIEVPKDKIQPGDLIFIDTTGKKQNINSVGVYIGDNTLIYVTSVGSAKVITSKFVGSNYYDFCVIVKRIV